VMTFTHTVIQTLYHALSLSHTTSHRHSLTHSLPFIIYLIQTHKSSHTPLLTISLTYNYSSITHTSTFWQSLSPSYTLTLELILNHTQYPTYKYLSHTQTRTRIRLCKKSIIIFTTLRYSDRRRTFYA
jgi:hypothetical protein